MASPWWICGGSVEAVSRAAVSRAARSRWSGHPDRLGAEVGDTGGEQRQVGAGGALRRRRKKVMSGAGGCVRQGGEVSSRGDCSRLLKVSTDQVD